MANNDIYWYVHTEQRTHVVNAQLGDGWPSITIGQPADPPARLLFRDDGTLTVASGDTHTVSSDTAEFYEETVTEDSGTITVENDAELVTGSEASRWGDLEVYGDYAGHASTGLGLNTVPHFNDQLDADAPITSLVVGLEPGPKPERLGRLGFWGVLVGVDDGTNAQTTRHELAFELWTLAKFEEYDSVEAVKADLEG